MKVDPGYAAYPKFGYFPYYFVREGMAFLAITGRTIDGKPASYEQTTFEERARDALAAVTFLKSRADIDAKRIGLHGSSLSSWVVPLAATMSSDVAYVILRVGSALPVHENILYEVESDVRQDDFSEGDVSRAVGLRKMLNAAILENTGWDSLRTALESSSAEPWFGYARVGWMRSRAMPPDSVALRDLRATISYDPIPVLQHLRVPVLAINGELDRAVNTKISVPLMRRALQQADNSDFTIVVLPRASHDLLEGKTGYNSEYAYRSRMAPGYWETMTQWLRKRGYTGR